ncbi:putative teichuronic acid biosynthesis glycosyltransferase TuaG [Bacteroides pyogenes]|uniref:glycosyltransferase family 2 protein n=1 Tax=Bacteroides pyogenes TaxID=310300 RepID=UPI001BAA420B|nr:glycosyltransferase family 2 protein [Bacteroides pyogenes]MBR8719431.1 putative teichuronic acid biosynthesis glycosyltransferase TuaG [Bacteroides pyogenes]MBR8786284.1 putative teichuronic acid biosynthesis glycosyltransferase TuaG [Bacteroides pyogenes]MBR8791767.1 putative teichuronic acid biosynthesis glycosyltransferase TuaG [Bacteroides pyogenes]MCF2708815.1 glycosyltransferase family 2 protein [Bacteroides pyogenes]
MALYNNETVSVITPVYNVAKLIDRTLESIVSQSYKDLEIVLVDDCSKDNSAEIIKRYQEKYPNIVYHKQAKNGGAAVARNTALDLAKGRYVAFLDSDDLWCEGKISKQLTFMKEKDAAISCTAIDCIDEEDKPLNSVREVKEKISYKFLLHNTMIATSTVMVDRNKTGDFQMPLRRGGQDYATWLMLMRNGTICYGLNEVLSHYRVMSNSLSSNKWKSIRQVWEIHTHDENINKVSAAINVCFFIANAFVKHFIK